MKRWMFGCVLVVALCWAVGALAAEVPVEGGSLRIVNGVVEGYDGAPTHVVIPSEADGVPVTEIRRELFSSCESLVSVQMPDTVITIGVDAFYDCANLETVQMPRRPIKLDEDGNMIEEGYRLQSGAFDSCTSLESIDLTGVWRLEISVFAGCTALQEVLFDPALRIIGAGAFSECTSLAQLDIPDTVVRIDSFAFENTPFDRSLTDDMVMLGQVLYRCNQKLSGRFEVPETVENIGAFAFEGQGITELICGDNVISIGSYAFAECMNLRKVSLGKNLVEVGRDAFAYCTSLEQVQFSYHANTRYSQKLYIGANAFRHCTALQSIVLPAYVGWVDYSAFNGCTSLRSVTFLSVVETIYYGAFVECPNLRSVYIGLAVMEPLERDEWIETFEDHTVIYYDSPNNNWDGYTVRPQPKLMPCGYAFLQDGVETDGFPTAAGRYQLRATLCPSHEKSADSLFPMTAFAAFYQDDHLLHIQSFALTADDWQSLGTDRVDVGELALPITVPEGANRARLLLWSSGGLQPLTVDGWIQ